MKDVYVFHVLLHLRKPFFYLDLDHFLLCIAWSIHLSWAARSCELPRLACASPLLLLRAPCGRPPGCTLQVSPEPIAHLDFVYWLIFAYLVAAYNRLFTEFPLLEQPDAEIISNRVLQSYSIRITNSLPTKGGQGSLFHIELNKDAFPIARTQRFCLTTFRTQPWQRPC